MRPDTPLLDMQFGLSQLSGNKKLLISLLDKFRLEYQETQTTLQGLLDSNQRAEAKQSVHTLKGVSGNLGLSALHQHCKILEDEIVAEEPLEQAFAQFSNVLSDTLSYIAKLSAGEEEEAAAPQGEPQQPCGKSELIAALKRNEFIGEDQLNTMVAALDIDEATQNSLLNAINDLDYPTALELLNAN